VEGIKWVGGGGQHLSVIYEHQLCWNYMVSAGQCIGVVPVPCS